MWIPFGNVITLSERNNLSQRTIRDTHINMIRLITTTQTTSAPTPPFSPQCLRSRHRRIRKKLSTSRRGQADRSRSHHTRIRAVKGTVQRHGVGKIAAGDVDSSGAKADFVDGVERSAGHGLAWGRAGGGLKLRWLVGAGRVAVGTDEPGKSTRDGTCLAFENGVGGGKS